MGPIIAAILISQVQTPALTRLATEIRQQDPEFLAKRSEANAKFRKMVAAAKTLSVQMTLRQVGSPAIGHAVLTISRPDKVYYHLSWGKDDYTFTILNGKATEVDLAGRGYDEYYVPTITGPVASGTEFASFFPSIFVSESILLPPDCFDDAGHIKQYAIGSDDEGRAKKNVIAFSDYKFNIPIPDSRFVQTIPAGLSAYQIVQPAPPLQIEERIPNLSLVSSKGTATNLKNVIDGRTLIAYLDPQCQPSVSSLLSLQRMRDIPVVILSASPKGAGLKTGNLPAYYDPRGAIGRSIRAPMTPLFFLVDSNAKILKVWYGFDRRHPDSLTTQVTKALKEVQG